MQLVFAKQHYFPLYQAWVQHWVRPGELISQTPFSVTFIVPKRPVGGQKEKYSSVLTIRPSLVSPENRFLLLFFPVNLHISLKSQFLNWGY